MTAPELRTRIRRLFFAEHWKVGTIAKELGVHHDTVRRALGIFPEQMDLALRVPRGSILEPYQDFIGHVLKEHPRLTGSRVFEMVRARGYTGGPAQVRRYIRKMRPVAAPEAYLRLSTLPGEQAQVDWGIFGKVQVGNAERTLSCFVMVLSWSRAMYARFMLDQKLESFMRGHIEAFEALGGVPRSILYDNLKSVVLERNGDAIRFHPRLLELAGHYHFAPKPCAPYRGNEKGKVERTIRYMRDSFFAARRFSSVANLNEQLRRWMDDIAFARPAPGHGSGQSVRAMWEEERPRLLPLPEHPFETDLVVPVSSGKTPYVRFDGNDYSIPHELIRRPLTLVASEAVVRILDGTREIARHERSWDRRQLLENPAHIAALARVKRAAHELRGRDLLRTVCKSADALLSVLAERGENLGGHTQRLLGLLDRYGARELDHAVQDVLTRGAYSADAVAHVLDQRARKRKQPPPLQTLLPDDPRIRDMRIPQHSLTEYDALGETTDENEPT